MMGLFGKAKKAERPTQSEAYERFQAAIADAIREARDCAVWPANLAPVLHAHADNLNMQQARR
jgi:hypothetical protein